MAPLAIVPCHVDRVSPRLARVWTVRAWERGLDSAALGLTEDETADAVVEVLTLLSFALSVEPQLIRFARRLLDTGRRELRQHEERRKCNEDRVPLETEHHPHGFFRPFKNGKKGGTQEPLRLIFERGAGRFPLT